MGDIRYLVFWGGRLIRLTEESLKAYDTVPPRVELNITTWLSGPDAPPAEPPLPRAGEEYYLIPARVLDLVMDDFWNLKENDIFDFVEDFEPEPDDLPEME